MNHVLHSMLGNSECLSTLQRKLNWELFGLNQFWDCFGSRVGTKSSVQENVLDST